MVKQNHKNKKIDVAAYVWPAYTGDEPRMRIFWPEGIGEWQSVRNSGPKENGYYWHREPLWGYVNEADPDVMNMQIEQAVSHGVTTFIYDWYWYDSRPFLENCLNDGFLKAENCGKMKFYLMWANHDATDVWDIRNSDKGTVIWKGAVNENQFRKIAERWIKKYFTQPNYYLIDNRPVISVYDIQNLTEGLGGIENTKENLSWFDEECKKNGFDGVHLQFVKWGSNPLNLSGVDSGIKSATPEIVDYLGFRSITHYQFVHFLDMEKNYADLENDLAEEYRAITENYRAKYLPHVSVGWDNNPRFVDFHGPVLNGSNPESFKIMLRIAKKFARENNSPLITVNSWNEWTESSYLEPDNINGYGYLDGIKEVFPENITK